MPPEIASQATWLPLGLHVDIKSLEEQPVAIDAASELGRKIADTLEAK